MKIKTILTIAACAVFLSITQVQASACDDVIILEKAKQSQIGELKDYLKTCRLNEKRNKNAKLKSILKNCEPVLTKEEKEAKAKKDADYQIEIKRLKEKTKKSLRSVDDIKHSGRKL